MPARLDAAGGRAETLIPQVFWPSVLLICLFVGLAFWNPQELGLAFTATQAVFSTRFGWLYILAVNVFVLYSVWLMLSRHGRVRLGGEGAKPSFSRLAWFSMLFSAGMGIGLVFWSVAEPIHHFSDLPFLFTAGNGGTTAALTPEARAQAALTLTMFHWGFHAWAIYAVTGLALAYAAYNRGLPLTVRSAFHPLLGDRVNGWPGHVIDVIAVIATLFGLATSLGLGAAQINAGLDTLLGIAPATTTQIMLIAGITAIALASVVSGLERGVRMLSQINMALAAALLAFVFVAGPTLFLIDATLQNAGTYLQNLPRMSTWTEAYAGTGRGSSWQHGWTIFYWAWWISWSPFVGLFIARISYGRTIREVVAAVLIVPTLVTLVWMSVFGGTALHGVLAGAGDIVAAVKADPAIALFAMLRGFPLPILSSVVAIVLIVVFFVTSSDSGSLVIDTITSGGHPHPPVLQKVFWAVTEGVVAAALLLAGGLKALQAGTILMGLPFAAVLIVMCWSLTKALREDGAGASAGSG